jgi:hypothetical protein
MSMTKEQRDILVGLVEGAADPFGYKIATIEFPCDIHGEMKVVTEQYDPTTREIYRHVDIYGADGRTISTETRPLTA